MIGLSLLTLDPATVGGTQTYARELVRALGEHGTLDYRVFVSEIAPEAGGDLSTTVVPEFPAGKSRARRIAGLAFATLSDRRLRRALAREDARAFHFPLTVMLPRVGVPAAITVHDLQHEVFPEFFSRAELAYRRRVYGWTVRKSRIVITISEHAREALVERLHLDPERVRAIYLAVDHERFRPDGRPRELFLLYPANAWKHKNHARLFDAFSQVRRERPELRLMLTGSGHEHLTLPDGAESSGHVTLDELVDLYRSAAALVYPSLYEGFGIPCVEAMACGCPVAASNVASLPEVCGDAAVYFDPVDPESIADGIRTVLDHPPAGGPERAARFTWDECARRHDEVYEELSGSG